MYPTKMARKVTLLLGYPIYFTYPTILYDILFLKFKCTNLNQCKILPNKFLIRFDIFLICRLQFSNKKIMCFIKIANA